MLLFSTVLELNSSFKRESFYELVNEWNAGNPYEENVIKDLNWDGHGKVRFGDDNLWLAAEEWQSTTAVRYEKKQDNGTYWDTDYIMNYRNMKMAVRLERSYSEDAFSSDGNFSTPRFIASLIDKGYLKADGPLPVTKTPIYINDDNIEILAAIINGEEKLRYPVVYVSKSFNNEDPIDVKMLAYNLKGIAHVLVQEDKSTSIRLKNLCDGKNEYKGMAGIYYPKEAFKNQRFKYKRENGFDPVMMKNIVREVLNYCNSRMIDPLFTWQGINNALLNDSVNLQSKERERAEQAKNILEQTCNELNGILENGNKDRDEEIRAKVDEAVNELMEAYNEDLERFRAKVKQLTEANDILNKENASLKARLDSQGHKPLINYGEEHDFYADEIKDIILSSLDESSKNVRSNTRRYDILKDIINSNDYSRITEHRASEIARLLKTYKGMNPKLKQQLEDYGFYITEGGKHYKVSYYNDTRYNQTLSKTPSDWRTGKICGRDFNQLAF